MQKPHLELKEIVWELVGLCKNGCEYCGSKELWNSTVSINDIKIIAERISDYLVSGEVNISGGDPLLVDYTIHQYVTDLLKISGNKVKIIVNPKSFFKTHMNSSTLDLYDLIGVSINTEEEMSLAMNYFKDFPKKYEKVVVITNFNLNNIFFFDKICEFISTNNLTWQIQYTMSATNTNAIYTQENAREHLFTKITNALNNGNKILVADNMNTGYCGAGLRSCGITYLGEVIPCLSMRSWSKDLQSYGNILQEPLGKIWEKGFYQQRFQDFECCKDICNSPYKISNGELDIFGMKIKVDETLENKEGFKIMPIPNYPPLMWPRKYPENPLPPNLLYGVNKID